MLRLEDVRKAYGGEVAVRGVELGCDRDRTTVLIGPSGCGKSTLLRMMVGLVRPDAGRVLLEGVELTPRSAPALRLRMGYVIQEGGLFPHLDARGNVALLALHLRWPAGRVEARLEELCALTRFPREALGRLPAELSGGQRQRVGLMRALLLDPDVLLLDEPLGALDPMVRAELQQDLRAIFGARGKTVVLVTHDLREAAYFADRVVLMRAGGIVQQGSVEALRERPAEPFVRAFLRAQEGAA